jgi:hypothetical protein
MIISKLCIETPDYCGWQRPRQFFHNIATVDFVFWLFSLSTVAMHLDYSAAIERPMTSR